MHHPEPAPSRAAQRKQCVLETEQPLEDTELEEQAFHCSSSSCSSGAASTRCGSSPGTIMCAHFYLFIDPPIYSYYCQFFLYLPVLSTRADACLLHSPLAPPRRRAYTLPAPADADAGPNPPARAPAPAARLPFTFVLPPVRAAHPYSPPAQQQQSLAPAPDTFAVLTDPQLASFGKDDTICMCWLYVSPASYTSLPSAPRTPSTLSLSTPPGMLPMVRSMSFVANVGRESQVREGEEAQSRERAVPILPVLCLLRIDDADDNAREGEDDEDEDAWVDEDDDDDGGKREMTAVDERNLGRDGEGDEELLTLVPWWSDLLAPRTPPALRIDFHVSAPPAAYLREATPTPYSQKEGEQAGGKRKW
ncbi:hypothetical protein B0H14DRAFT_3625080 [Mycena olivaceomarginata]|nr:hypothetical protein B0H14DRAFT_3625080 [Mycena olivaceomarginata]